MESVCTDIDKPYNLEDVSVLGPHATYVCMYAQEEIKRCRGSMYAFKCIFSSMFKCKYYIVGNFTV